MDLTVPQCGNFSAEFRFSDWFVWAAKQKFTGGVLIHPAMGDFAIMWRKGAPCSVRGQGVKEDFLGQLLTAFGKCTDDAVQEALTIQQLGGDGDRPLLGALLKAQGLVTDADLNAALSIQTVRRLSRLFATVGGAWQSAPGENESLYRVGMSVDAKVVMIKGLRWHASDAELADAALALSQWAVKLRSGVDAAAALGADADDKAVIELLRFPRSIAALEAHVGNRRQVRAIMRSLMLLELIEPVPLGQAIAIARKEDVSDGLATGEFPSLPTEVKRRVGSSARPARRDSGFEHVKTGGFRGVQTPAHVDYVKTPTQTKTPTPPPGSGSFDAVTTGGFNRVRSGSGFDAVTTGGFRQARTPSRSGGGFEAVKTGGFDSPKTPALPGGGFDRVLTPGQPGSGFDGVKSGTFEGVRTPGLPGGGFERVRTPMVPISNPPTRRSSAFSSSPGVGVPVPPDFDQDAQTGDYPAVHRSRPASSASNPVIIPPPPRATSSSASRTPKASTSGAVTGRAATGPVDGVPDQLRGLVAEIDRLHSEMGALSAFELLGLEHDADAVKVSARRRALGRRYNPDALESQLPADIVQRARDLLSAVNQAAQMLADPAKRAEYVALERENTPVKAPPLARGPPEPKSLPSAAPAARSKDRPRARSTGASFAEREAMRREAKLRFKMGKVLMQKRDNAQAREHFRFCVEADEEDATYRAHYGWAFFTDPKLDRASAIERAFPLISAAALASKRDAEIQTFLGRVLKEKGMIGNAVTAFKTALRADPGYSPAARELTALGEAVPMQSAPPPEPADEQAGLGSRLGKMFRR